MGCWAQTSAPAPRKQPFLLASGSQQQPHPKIPCSPLLISPFLSFLLPSSLLSLLSFSSLLFFCLLFSSPPFSSPLLFSLPSQPSQFSQQHGTVPFLRPLPQDTHRDWFHYSSTCIAGGDMQRSTSLLSILLCETWNSQVWLGSMASQCSPVIQGFSCRHSPSTGITILCHLTIAGFLCGS